MCKDIIEYKSVSNERKWRI